MIRTGTCLVLDVLAQHRLRLMSPSSAGARNAASRVGPAVVVLTQRLTSVYGYGARGEEFLRLRAELRRLFGLDGPS